jgi:hypothetical protein
MSSTDSHGGSDMSHASGDAGYETSDFNWKGVVWSLPIAVILLITFFGVSIAWFKGAKDRELAEKQAQYQTTELNELHTREAEVLSAFKWVDKEKGRLQIPIDRAMELMAQEHMNAPGREWKPITDTYMQGAAFATLAAGPVMDAPGSGVSIEDVAPAKPKSGAKEKAGKSMAEGHKADERAK